MMGIKDRIKLKDFHIELNRDRVFHFVDCYPDSPVYQEVIKEYTDLEAEVYSSIKPEAILQFGNLNPLAHAIDYEAGVPACYVIMTVGNKISEISSQYFEEGNYLAGMLTNAMADDYLLQLDDKVSKIVKSQCLIRHKGVIQRLEVPSDIPMEAQKVVLNETGADKLLNMQVTEGYMFTTVKTSCFILILTEDENIFKLQHNCKKCNSINCKMREV